MKLHRHPLLSFLLLFLPLCLTLLQVTVAEQNNTDNVAGKGLVSFEFPWIVEAKVEVNLTAKLINLASKSVGTTSETTALIQMLNGIYVRTYDRETVDEKELVNYFRQKLSEDQWEVLFKINEDDEIVEVNLLFDEDKVHGIFIILIPDMPEEVTFVNIVGKIAPERVGDLLRNLSNFGAMDIEVSGKLKAQAVPTRRINQRELLAVKINYPPTINGTLNDACWKIAPQVDGFTHVETKNPVKDDSVFKMVYTPKAIYIGGHLYDSEPDKIVAVKTKDQVRFDTAVEDWISFSIDPFHTHRFPDRTFFMANPIGKKYVNLDPADPDRYKLVDQWNVAAKIVKDGWIVEMEIPWEMLNYPDPKEPILMGINFDRFQAHTRMHSWWSNIGPTERYGDDGHWLHVLPPPKSPDNRQGTLNTLGMDAYTE